MVGTRQKYREKGKGGGGGGGRGMKRQRVIKMERGRCRGIEEEGKTQCSQEGGTERKRKDKERG